VTSEQPTAVPNVHDDLNRELAFYNQALAAAKAGMLQLIEERCPFRCAPPPAPPGRLCRPLLTECCVEFIVSATAVVKLTVRV
jgi:hypothetical protein